MNVEKFDWNKANHSDIFDIINLTSRDAPLELIFHDASAEDTKKAYDALVNHGLVSSFKTEVWNDIIGKICEIAYNLDPIDFKKRFEVKRLVLSSPDRQKWIDYAHEKLPELDTDEKLEAWLEKIWKKCRPGEFEASHFNFAVHDCLPEYYTEFPYVKISGQLKGQYILDLVQNINWWTDIDPLPSAKKEVFKIFISTNASIPETLSVIINDLLSEFQVCVLMGSIDSVRGIINDAYRLILSDVLITQLQSIPFSSVINFMTLKMKVNILDKWPIYFIVADSFLYSALAKLSMLSPFPFGFTDEYQYYLGINCAYSDILSFCLKLLNLRLEISVSSDASDSLPFVLNVFLSNELSKVKVTSRRPLPFSVLDEFNYSGKVRLEHEGIETIEKEDDLIIFTDELSISIPPSANMEKEDEVNLIERKVELSQNESANFNIEDKTKIKGVQEELNCAKAHYISHIGKTKVEGDTSFVASKPLPLSVDNRTLKTRDFFEVGFANEQSFKARDGKLKTDRESITLDYSPQIDLLHDGSFDTEETMLLEHTYGIGMEADVSFTSVYSSRLESNRTRELEGESVINSTYLAELLFGLNAYLESEISGFITAYEASMYKYHIQGIAGIEQFVRTMDASSLSKVMDKVIAGEAITYTDIKSILLARLMRFLVSIQNSSTVAYDAQGTAAHPRIMNPKAIPVESSLDVFLDASYVGRDDVLEADGRVGFDLDVDPVVIPPAESFRSAVRINQASEVSLDETLSKRQEGTAISSSASEASCTLAHVSLTWATDLEDVLVSEKDSILVNEVERTLYF